MTDLCRGVLILGGKEEDHRKDCITICYGDDKNMDGTVDETPILLASGRVIRRLELSQRLKDNGQNRLHLFSP